MEKHKFRAVLLKREAVDPLVWPPLAPEAAPGKLPSPSAHSGENCSSV